MSEPRTQLSASENLAHAAFALVEIILVAVSGSFLVQTGFAFFEISGNQILSSTLLLFIFMSSEATVTLLLIAFFLSSRGETLAVLGWIDRNAGREILCGIAFVPVLFLATFGVGMFFELVLPEYISTTNPLLDLVRSYQDLFFFLISSIYVGGLKEEIQRAFVLDRFERFLGGVFLKSLFLFGNKDEDSMETMGRRVGIVLGLLLWSLFFAVGHAVQGVDNAAGAGVLGLLFGLLYIWRRNLVAPMVAHALYDISTLVAFWNFLKP